MTQEPTDKDWQNLHDAIRDGKLSAVEWFFDTFGNEKLHEIIPVSFNRPPLTVCARWSQPEIAEALIARGADPHQETEGFQPIDMLIDCVRNEKSVKLLKIFLREGCDPNRVRNGGTPLIAATQKANMTDPDAQKLLCDMVAEMMLAGGDADKELNDVFGVPRTARGWAEKNKKPEVDLALDAVNQHRARMEKAGASFHEGLRESVTGALVPQIKKVPFNQAVQQQAPVTPDTKSGMASVWAGVKPGGKFT